jgi:hypothetical protein
MKKKKICTTKEMEIFNEQSRKMNQVTASECALVYRKDGCPLQTFSCGVTLL